MWRQAGNHKNGFLLFLFRVYFCFYVIASGHPAMLSDSEFQHGAAEAVLYFEIPAVSVTVFCCTYSVESYYYEKLHNLIDDWESEIVEFKEAKGSYDLDKLGRYFSALSNEANLRNRQNGWLVFGVSETDHKHLVGTNYKKGKKDLLDKLKYEVGRFTTDELTFIDIIELFPRVNGTEYRILMFSIPAAAVGIPTEWNNRCWARNGSNIVLLQQAKIDPGNTG